MRWWMVLGCAIWAMGCTDDVSGPPAHRAGASEGGSTSKKRTTTTATGDEASDEANDDGAIDDDEGVEAPPGDVAAPVAPAGEPRLIEHIVGAGDPHYVYFDTRVRTQDRLVLYLGGANVKPIKTVPMLKEIASYGFRVVGLRYENDFIVQQICNAHPSDADCQGDLRREVIEGTNVSPYVNVSKADSIDARLATLLAGLAREAPDEGWGSFVEGGTPVWKDIIVAGHSSGASTAGRMSKLRELAGVFMLSGPNDNLDGVASKWMSEPARTPVQKIWAFSDTADGQFLQHKRGWTAMGLLGPATAIDGKTAPFDNAHRLTTSRPGGGHNSTNTGAGTYTEVWRHGLGL